MEVLSFFGEDGTCLSTFTTGDCHCEPECIMGSQFGGAFGHPRLFSTCSHAQLNATLLSGLGSCLFNDDSEVRYQITILSLI